VTEPFSGEARRVLEGYASGALALIAPDLLAAEIGNIVWKKVRLQGLAKADAEKIIAAFRELEILLIPSDELLEKAFQFAMAHERTVYDSLYIALCEREHCAFVTADERLVNAVNKSFPTIVWVANFRIPNA